MDWNYGKKRNNRSILDLYDDILVMIFTRLSISTILVCRSVCKSLYTFLSSHYFAESYRSNPPFTSLIVNFGEFFALLELNSGYNYSLKSIKPRILPDPFGLSYCGWGTRFLVGSCNGFFCYSDKDVLYVSNPFSAGTQHVRLPEEVLDGISKRSYGFGFCPQTQHYKVIELASFGKKKTRRTEVHVFTVGIDKFWRRIHSPFQDIEQTFEHVYPPIIQFLEVKGKGALHWIVDDSNRLDYLYSFDISDEEVRPILPPLGLKKRNISTQLLVSTHGCLCLLHMSMDYEQRVCGQRVEFWCMTDYMVQGSWTLRIISQTSFPISLRYSTLQTVAVLKNEEILMIDLEGNYIVSCNPEQKIFNKLDIDRPRHSHRGAACFVPNFFKTKQDDATARKLGQKTSKPTCFTEMMLSSVFIKCQVFQEKIPFGKPKKNLLSRVPLDRILGGCNNKGVCKISNPRFAETTSYKLNNNNTVHLILCDKASLRFLFELRSSVSNNNDVKANQLLGASPMVAKITVLGSCNGLVCLYRQPDQTTSHNICICNPVVRELAILPQPQGVKRINDEAYGFGFSSMTGHYKVLRILTRKWGRVKLEAYVLTIGIDKNWRQVVGGGGGATFRMPKKWPDNINKARFCDVPFNNAIHWVASEEGDSNHVIYAFDIDEERFTSLGPLPVGEFNRPYRYPCLGILRDCLCLCAIPAAPHPNYMVLWSMRSYGSRASWTRENISISLTSGNFIPTIPHQLDRKVVLPVTSWRDEEILMWVEKGGGTLLSYCLKEKRCTEIKIDIAANNEALIAVPYVL